MNGAGAQSFNLPIAVETVSACDDFCEGTADIWRLKPAATYLLLASTNTQIGVRSFSLSRGRGLG